MPRLRPHQVCIGHHLSESPCCSPSPRSRESAANAPRAPIRAAIIRNCMSNTTPRSRARLEPQRSSRRRIVQYPLHSEVRCQRASATQVPDTSYCHLAVGHPVSTPTTKAFCLLRLQHALEPGIVVEPKVTVVRFRLVVATQSFCRPVALGPLLQQLVDLQHSVEQRLSSMQAFCRRVLEELISKSVFVQMWRAAPLRRLEHVGVQFGQLFACKVNVLLASWSN
mmetsp:Transcript_58375/g.130101  ORF Transcript_58375/g.130101 Transcript_58375/m.130101 type:complete len:224 (-) Transcript_58375:126-797(-)